MLKKSIIVLFIAITSSLAQAQDKWFNQKLSDKVSVNFPFEPRKLSDNNYGIRAEDETGYLVSFVNLLDVTKMTKEAFNVEVGTKQFATEFINGMTPKLAKFTFAPYKITTVKGYTAYQLSGRSDELNTTIFINIVFVDGTSYSITCLIPDGKSIKNKDRFMNEIYINGK